MAMCKLTIPKEFQQKLENLSGNNVAIIDKMLTEAGKVVKDEVKSCLQAVLSAEHQDGELVNSLGVSPVGFDTKTGTRNIKVGFSKAPRKDGKRNGEIASYIDHGTSKMAARPFMNKAKAAAKPKAIKEMERVFDEEVAKL